MEDTRWLGLGIVVALAGCTQGGALGPTPPHALPAGQTPPGVRALFRGLSPKITHVVIIVQENRTTNDLFNALKGADTTRVGTNSQGKMVTLLPEKLTAPYDISHAHAAFETEYAKGQGNGFDQVKSSCSAHANCPPPNLRAYGYVPEHEVEPYYVMARRYAFANHMFQTNEGPSFPAHQYILSGTSTIADGSPLRAAENPNAPGKQKAGGCDSPKGSLVTLINRTGQENKQTYPCFDRNSIIGLIEQQPSLSWHYYQAHFGPGLWEAPDAILPVYNSPQFATDVVAPSSQVLTDVDAGNLANVVWVMPTGLESDHAKITDGSGPSWVASVVNKIGQSQFWDSTAIFVTWDDWGGWYDQIVPTQRNSYELGFRVPLIVISPYAKTHYISTKQHEFGSILKFTEETFGLGSLGTTDVRSDDLSDCFDFSQPARKFVPIPAPKDAAYFLHQPPSNEDPDDDF